MTVRLLTSRFELRLSFFHCDLQVSRRGGTSTSSLAREDVVNRGLLSSGPPHDFFGSEGSQYREDEFVPSISPIAVGAAVVVWLVLKAGLAFVELVGFFADEVGEYGGAFDWAVLE